MSTMNITKIDSELKKLQLQMSHSIKRTKTYITDLGDLIATLDDNKSNKKSSENLSPLDFPSTTIQNQSWSIQENIHPTNKTSSPSNVFSPSVEYSAYGSDNSDTDYGSSSSFDLYQLSEDMVDNNILNGYGYEIDNKIINTTNGRIYLGKLTPSTSNNGARKRNRINLSPSPLIKANYNMLFGVETATTKQVVIKKYDKDNEININGENIVKEAIILNYLTVQNHPPSNNICKFFDFIETDDAYYLVEEYCGVMTLDTFISIAHKYIREKTLKIKHWRVIVKYLFWQLVVNLYWMHNDMKCVHLDLNDAKNIMIENANFIKNKTTGLINIDTKNLSLKLVDFGQSELYAMETNSESFVCDKHEFTTNYSYKCPEQVRGEVFNGVKADMYGLGVLLYKMFTGRMPYKYPDISDDGYEALQNNKFETYFVSKMKLLKRINKNAMNLMESLLNFDPKKRIDTSDIIKNSWFTNYYIRYKYRIQQKTKSQKQRHILQKHRYKLPYYSLL